ncbi:hypothetical protein AOLI_G00120550 [Acnodon oligacanthus]
MKPSEWVQLLREVQAGFILEKESRAKMVRGYSGLEAQDGPDLFCMSTKGRMESKVSLTMSVSSATIQRHREYLCQFLTLINSSLLQLLRRPNGFVSGGVSDSRICSPEKLAVRSGFPLCVYEEYDEPPFSRFYSEADVGALKSSEL